MGANARRVALPGLVLQALRRADEAPCRVGFTVTRKVGNAVARNRIRRRLREVVRLVLRQRPVRGFDFVLIGRAATRERRFADLLADFRRALDKAGAP